MEQATLKQLALLSETPLPVLSFRFMPVPPALSFRSLGYGVIKSSHFIS